MKSCFFIGHRFVNENIQQVLIDTVERHVEQHGVTEFIVGRYGEFDKLSANAVIQAKKRYPHICLRLLLPYHPAERPIETPFGFDNTFYPPGMEKVPRRFAIIRANCYMIDHADYLIAYVWHTASNAQKFLEYAEKRDIVITNIADRDQIKSLPCAKGGFFVSVCYILYIMYSKKGKTVH